MAWVRSNTGGLQLDHMVGLLTEEDRANYQVLVDSGASHHEVIDYLGAVIKKYYENGTIRP